MPTTIRLWWDTHNPQSPRWAYTILEHGPTGLEVGCGYLSDAALDCDDEQALIAVFRREWPEYREVSAIEIV